MNIDVEELAARLQGELRGNRQVAVRGAHSLEKAGPEDVTFVTSEKNLRRLKTSAAGAVIVGRNLADSLSPADGESSRAVIVVDDPQAAFLKVLATFRPTRPRPEIGISPHAFVSPTARIGAGTNVYPGACIGDDVTIGDGCDIFPGVSIADGCRLGDQVQLHANVVLYPGMRIGHRVIVQASAVIGADGFGYRLMDGRHRKLPHFGTVEIGDDVEIGAGATIDRAMIGATVIGEGSKIDNQVVVAHNCEVGRHNLFVSQVGLAGSVVTGDYVICAGQVGIADHVQLGDGCVVGAKAGVHKDLPGGQAYHGIPAVPAAEALRIVTAQYKLPELRKQVRQLETQIEELTRRVETLLAERRAA